MRRLATSAVSLGLLLALAPAVRADVGSADLALTVTKTKTSNVEKEAVYYRDSLQLHYVVKNLGPDTATNIVLTDVLPKYLTPPLDPDPMFVDDSRVSCEYFGPWPERETETDIRCSVSSLANGASIEIGVNVVANETGTGIATISPGVVGSEADPLPGNDVTGLEPFDILPYVNLSIGKQAGVAAAVRGSSVPYTIRVQNFGAAAGGVVVTDTLPAGMRPYSAAWDAGTCAIAGQTVTCNIGSMDGNDTVDVAIGATAVTRGTWSNAASVSATDVPPVASPPVTVKVTLPDLTARWLSKTGLRCRGTSCSMSAKMRIRNAGDASAGAFVARVYLSSDKRVGRSDKRLWSKTYGGIGAGRYVDRILSFGGLPRAARGKYLILFVDATRRVAEISEANNLAATRIL